MAYFILGVIAGIAGTLAVQFLSRRRGSGAEESDDFYDPLNPEQIEKRRKKLDTILALAHSRQRITSSDVRRTLNIPEATAIRYLGYLVTLGKLIQTGERGRDTSYQLPEK